MKWEEFLKLTESLSVIDSEFLLVGEEHPEALRVQLSRWHKAGKLIKLRRGLYVVSEIYRKNRIYEPFLASMLKKPSYLSLEKALEFHGLIPEGVMVFTSVTTRRPERIVTPMGIFDYRHMKKELFWGYSSLTIDRQTGFMALPEKALLDFFYLKNVPASPAFLHEMRLQQLDALDQERLFDFAQRFKKPGIIAAAEAITHHTRMEMEQEEIL